MWWWWCESILKAFHSFTYKYCYCSLICATTRAASSGAASSTTITPQEGSDFCCCNWSQRHLTIAVFYCLCWTIFIPVLISTIKKRTTAATTKDKGASISTSGSMEQQQQPPPQPHQRSRRRPREESIHNHNNSNNIRSMNNPLRQRRPTMVSSDTGDAAAAAAAAAPQPQQVQQGQDYNIATSITTNVTNMTPLQRHRQRLHEHAARHRQRLLMEQQRSAAEVTARADVASAATAASSAPAARAASIAAAESTTTSTTNNNNNSNHSHNNEGIASTMPTTSITSITTNNNASRNASRLKAPPDTSFNVHSLEDRQRALGLIQKQQDQHGSGGGISSTTIANATTASTANNNNNINKDLWKHLPLAWKHDKEFILAALDNHSAELPEKSEFERTFSQALRFDKDIVLAFCRRPDFVIHKEDIQNDTTTTAESSKHDDDDDDDDRGLYYERHLYVPGCLTNDKDVMMAYCQKIPRSLQDCSEELCNDRDVVTAAITHCSGLELQYASVQLQQDIDMVKLACANHGRALEFCPLLSPTRQALVEDRDFMLTVVLNNPGGGPMWKLLPLQLRMEDEELLLRALTNGLLLRNVPSSFLRLDFLIQAIQHNCSLYLQLKNLKVPLPPSVVAELSRTTTTAMNATSRTSRVRDDQSNATKTIKWNNHPSLAREAILSQESTPEIHAAALGDDGCPSLKDNRQVVIAICQRGSKELLEDILGPATAIATGNDNDINDNDDEEGDAALAAVLQFNMGMQAADADQDDLHFQDLPALLDDNINHNNAPPPPPPPPAANVPPPRSRFCDDMEIMKLAVGRDPAFFSVASARLRTEPELILATITPDSAWNTIKTVPWSIQRDHPAITIKAIELCSTSNLRYLPTHIPEDMWTNHRDICIAWIRRGGRVLDVFERRLRSDIEMALLIPRYCWHEFYKVGERLLADRAFILQAVQLEGRVFRFVSAALRRDVELQIMAVAHYYERHTAGVNGAMPVPHAFAGLFDVEALKGEIQRKLDLHGTFLNQFLRGITIKTPHLAPALRSQLTMLDRGVETSQAFKHLIADYVGVPVGPKLSLLRKADENLRRNDTVAARTVVGGGDNAAAAAWEANDHSSFRRFRMMARRDANRRIHRHHNMDFNNNDEDDDDDDMDDPDDDLRGDHGRMGLVRARDAATIASSAAAADVANGNAETAAMLARREDMRRLRRADREAALNAMRTRQEERDRRLQEMMATMEASHREMQNQFQEVQRRAAESRERAVEMRLRAFETSLSNLDPTSARPAPVERPPAALHAADATHSNGSTVANQMFAFRELADAGRGPRTEFVLNRVPLAPPPPQNSSNAFGQGFTFDPNRYQRQQDQQNRDRLLAAERNRRSDEMLARVEARNARHRAAERRGQDISDNTEDNADGYPSLAPHRFGRDRDDNVFGGAMGSLFVPPPRPRTVPAFADVGPLADHAERPPPLLQRRPLPARGDAIFGALALDSDDDDDDDDDDDLIWTSGRF